MRARHWEERDPGSQAVVESIEVGVQSAGEERGDARSRPGLIKDGRTILTQMESLSRAGEMRGRGEQLPGGRREPEKMGSAVVGGFVHIMRPH